MKTLNYILSALLLTIGISANLHAQNTLEDRNVTVVREYTPVIQDAGKISSVPEVLEPTVEKTKAAYSEFNLPLNADFNIHTLDPAELQLNKKREPKTGFARFGIGNNMNTLLDFATPIIKQPDMRLDFSLNHYGTFDTKVHSVTKSALAFDKYFDSFNLFAGMGGSHEYLNYYGNEFNSSGKFDFDSLAIGSNYTEADLRYPQTIPSSTLQNSPENETFWRFNTYLGIKSLPLATGIRYNTDVQYKIFDTKYGLQEQQIKTHAGFNTLRDKNRLGLDLDMYNLMYKSTNTSISDNWDSYSVFAMNPYYSMERTTWNMRVGVKSSFSFIHGKPFNPSADINAEWKIIPKYFSIYMGITGGYNVNTLDEMFTENRYLFTDIRVKDTYTPYEFFGGFKLKPIYNLLIDAFVDYRYINNQYFFVNKGYTQAPLTGTANDTIFSNRFNVIYSGATQLKVGIRANYNLRNRLNIQVKGAYNNWNVTSEQYAWNKPKWEADFSTNYRITRNFSIDGNVFVDGERYAKLGNQAIRMRPKVDINLGASYSYSNWFTVFGKVNNIINNPYQNYYGYDVQGFNVLAGAAFSF